eukprot:7390494-Prymnesium_polylepis.1
MSDAAATATRTRDSPSHLRAAHDARRHQRAAQRPRCRAAAGPPLRVQPGDGILPTQQRARRRRRRAPAARRRARAGGRLGRPPR